MTLRIPRSQAAEVSSDFPAAVEAHRQALLAHRFSEPARQYKEAIPAIPAIPPTPGVPAKGRFPARPPRPGYPGRAAVPAVEAFAGTPRPTAHPLIEACITRVPTKEGPDDFVSDFELYDE